MPAERLLGTFTVRAAAAEAAAFAREVGSPGQSVPFTFPVRWLARPDFQAAAVEMIGDANWVPIHESQSFDYRAPLTLDADYAMTVTMKRETEPSRIILSAYVGVADEAPSLSMEMTLRIVPLPAGQAA
ncbi:hypothetical protein [uncultured Methylovirgula sp.]|uniref:hypothetical protein n=1 Tax=uncultured Methylovirgula sp. TaxID=1285960 RepID=UPI0026237BFA|nr:hypothetical protein [uncultured Methylovirgula sp.]